MFVKHDLLKLTRRAILAAAALLVVPAALAQTDPLPSWNDTAPKAAIVAFVEKVSKEGSPDFVPEPERIAVFDNDGTLWTEHPMYVQLAFALDRVKAEAPNHPEWATTQPFQAVLEGDMKTLAAAGEKGLVELIMATHAGMTVDAIPDNRIRLDRHRARSTLQEALYGVGLPTDARTSRLSARQRLQDVHRLRRRHRASCALGQRRSMAYRQSRSSVRRSRRSSR